KIERNEAALLALTRELEEELGIAVTVAHPWTTREYVYSHAHVRLNFFRVLSWSGDPRPCEQQLLSWQRPGHVAVTPLLPANAPVLRSLHLPPVLGITDAWERGELVQFQQLESALQRGLRMVMVRERQTPREKLRVFAANVVEQCKHVAALVLVNGDEDIARASGAHGVHMTSSQLRTCTRRPDFIWCGASCHDQGELERAAALGLDYVVLGPVRDTPSHPDAIALGWRTFGQMVRGYPLPIYALGGMVLDDLSEVARVGAHGVAMIRGAWAGRPGQLFPSGW